MAKLTLKGFFGWFVYYAVLSGLFVGVNWLSANFIAQVTILNNIISLGFKEWTIGLLLAFWVTIFLHEKIHPAVVKTLKLKKR